MNVSVGTDIVAIARITSLIRDHGDRFISRWFTPEETAYCQSKAQPAQHFAARFAAKEAVAKALRSPWNDGIPWRDIEVVVSDDGVPLVRLSGQVREVADRQLANSIQVSLSHCGEYATATAVCLRH